MSHNKFNHQYKNNPEISAAELNERLAAGENLLIIDVREVIEYHTFNVGGINIPLSTLQQNMQTCCSDKLAEIVVVCQAGLRSETAQSILLEAGYQNVRNLTGGLLSLHKLKK